MGTGNILIDGTETFVPVFNRLREIAQEFIPYFIFIAIGALAIYTTRGAVKTIMKYLQRKSKNAMEDRRNKKIYYSRRNKARREMLEYYKHGEWTDSMNESRDKRKLGRRPGQ